MILLTFLQYIIIIMLRFVSEDRDKHSVIRHFEKYFISAPPPPYY